jgi:hypothetical protein
MSSTAAVTHTARTDTRTNTPILLMGWLHDPALHFAQLTHAVREGQHIAACGIRISFLGAPWPAFGAGNVRSRCSICAQAVQGAWKGAGSRPGVR